MKIFCKELKKYYKIPEAYQEKGNPILESMYLSFCGNGKGFAYFGSKEGRGRITFYYEEEPNEKIPNFFINTNKFISIFSTSDFVSLNSNLVFSVDKDKYKIATIIDDDQIETKIFDTVYDSEFVFDKEKTDKVIKALSFVHKEDASNFQGIFIEDNHICGLSSKTPVYEAVLDTNNAKLAIQMNIAKTIIQVGSISDQCVLYSGVNVKNKKIVSNDGELEMIVPNSNSLDFPPTRSQSFIDSYTSNMFVKVDSALLSKTLDSLKYYYNDVLNSKIKISINEDLVIIVEDKLTNVERHIPYLEVSDELKNKQYAVSAVKVQQAMSVLRDSEITIAFPDPNGGPMINFYNDENSHCVITRFKE